MRVQPFEKNEGSIVRLVIAFSAIFAVLAGCTGHEYEPREPGVTVSGEAGFGVKYSGGEVSPVQNGKLRVHLGGHL